MYHVYVSYCECCDDAQQVLLVTAYMMRICDVVHAKPATLSTYYTMHSEVVFVLSRDAVLLLTYILLMSLCAKWLLLNRSQQAR
jgi:hypothetical protein